MSHPIFSESFSRRSRRRWQQFGRQWHLRAFRTHVIPELDDQFAVFDKPFDQAKSAVVSVNAFLKIVLEFHIIQVIRKLSGPLHFFHDERKYQLFQVIPDGAIPRDLFSKEPIHKEFKKNDADEDE